MALIGSTTPRLWTRPLVSGPAGPCGCGCALTPATSLGFAVAEFAALIGLPLLPWQRWLVIHGMELLPDGMPRYRTLLVIVARQNGKTTLLKVLALFWLAVQSVPLVLGTSTKLDYARESWAGAVDLAYGTPELQAVLLPRRQGVREANGEQTLTTADGCRYKIAAANGDAGRSLTVHRLILDELRQHRSWSAWSASTKATMAVPDAQTWAITSAGDRYSVVLNSLRKRATEQIELAPDGDASAPPVFLAEWSAVDGCALDDRLAWVQANPSLGYGTVTEQAIAEAMSTDPESVFRTEVLCQQVDSMDARKVDPRAWESLTDPDSTPLARPAWLAVETSSDLRSTSVAAAGRRADGVLHVERLEMRPGYSWVAEYLAAKQVATAAPVLLITAAGSSSAALQPLLEEAGVEVTPVTMAKYASACVSLQAMVERSVAGDVVLAHRGDPLVAKAIEQAATVRVGDDGWRWLQRDATDDVSILGAITLALWGAVTFGKPEQILY